MNLPTQLPLMIRLSNAGILFAVKRAVMFRTTIFLIALGWVSCVLSAAAAVGAEKTRVAVITSGLDAAMAEKLVDFEVALAKVPEIEVVPREETNRILETQKLAITDAVTSSQAVDAGSLLKTELFIIVRQTPGQANADDVGVVVFDAKRGVRLADRTLTSQPKQVVPALGAIFKQSLAKIRPSENVTRIVSVVAIRNVDLGPGRDSQCAGFVEVLERDLVNSPQVIVLDRSHMELISRPQALANDAVVQNLLAATLRLDVQFSQAPEQQVDIEVMISDARQRSKKVAVRVPAKQFSQANVSLKNEVLHALKLAVPAEGFDRSAEARRLVHEAVFQMQQKRYERSLMLTEAAYALAPNEPSLVSDFLALMQKNASMILWKSENPFDHLKPFKCTPAEFEKAADLVVRGLEIAIRRREREAKQGGVRLFYMTGDWEAYESESNLVSLVYHLHTKAEEPTETGRALAKDAQVKARQLYVNLIMYTALNSYGKANQSAAQIGFWMMVTRKLPMLTADWNEWLQTLIWQQELALAHLAKTPPTLIKHSTGAISKLGNFSLSYVELLQDTVPPSPKDREFLENERYYFHYEHLHDLATSEILTAAHYHQLRQHYQAMSNHKLAGVRIVGLGATLWAEFHLQAITAEQLLVELKALQKNAERLIADPGLAGEPEAVVNAERVACYEAMLFVIDILGRVSPNVRPQRDEFLNFMRGRKELVTSAIWSVAGAGAKYLNGESITNPTTMVFPYLYVDHGETREQLAQKLKPFRELLNNKQTKILDGGRTMIEELLRRAIPEDKPKPSSITSPKLATPWKQAVPLLLCSEFAFMDSLSQPILDGDHMYVVGTRGNGVKFQQDLFQISLVDGTTKILGKFEIEIPVADVTGPEIYRRPPVVQGEPVLVGDRVYVVICDDDGAVRVEGIVGISTKGEPALRIRPKSHPDMATAQIDAIAALDDGLLALSSGMETSFVLWFDFKKQTWETIAASNRAAKKTLLDHPEVYLNELVVDPPRHRILFTMIQIRSPPHLHTGLFEFNTQTRKIKKLFAFPHNGPSGLAKVSDNALWVVFPFFDDLQRVFEMNLATQEWELILTRVKHKWCEVDGKPFDDEKKGPVRNNRNWVVPKNINLDKPRYAGSHNLIGPYAEADGAIWTFSPFTRVTSDGKKTSLPPVSELPYEMSSVPSRNVTLRFLEKQNAILYGNPDGVWLLQMPTAKPAK